MGVAGYSEMASMLGMDDVQPTGMPLKPKKPWPPNGNKWHAKAIITVWLSTVENTLESEIQYDLGQNVESAPLPQQCDGEK